MENCEVISMISSKTSIDITETGKRLKKLAQRHLERCPSSTEFLALLFHAVQLKNPIMGEQERP